MTHMKEQHCISCKRMTITYIDNSPDKSVEEIVKDLLPGASNALMTLILSQIKNCGNQNASQNRWEIKIINECLKWYTRSLQSYQEIRQSGLLLLQLPTLLVLYKNSIERRPGIQNHIFEWMDGCRGRQDENT